MKIYGSYINQKGKTVSVTITISGSTSSDIEIGADGSPLYFADEDAVTTESGIDDTFDTVIGTGCTIALQASRYIPELYQQSPKDARVIVTVDGKEVFAGYIEPLALSQDYVSVADDIELTCVDELSLLDNRNYKGIRYKSEYNATKQSARELSFLDIIKGMISDDCELLYDGSKSVDNTAEKQFSIFSDLTINELLFLGDDLDDVWTDKDVLEAMLTFLNLHAVSEGRTIYLFSWETLQKGEPITFASLRNGVSAQIEPSVINIDMSTVEDDETTLEVNDTYNQIKIDVSPKTSDDLIEAPLDDDSLSNAFRLKQKYMTSIDVGGIGKDAHAAFSALVQGGTTQYANCATTDWFLQVQKSRHWKFGAIGKDGDTTDWATSMSSDHKGQLKVADRLKKQLGCVIMKVGKVQTRTETGDNSKISSVEMTAGLVVSVNGNGKDTEGEYYPNADAIRAAMPIAQYIGSVSGGAFSPSDDYTTNYIVINGKIVLVPIVSTSGEYGYLKQHAAAGDGMQYFGIVNMGDDVSSNDKGMRCDKWYQADLVTDTPTELTGVEGWEPWRDTGDAAYEYQYSAVGDGTDTISKIGVLECMLRIGDKVLVEDKTGDGQIKDFSWQTYKPLPDNPTDADVDEYYKQTFTIGFDPKIGDKLIGTEYDIQNNIDYTMGLDTSGTAIPIRHSDKLHGQVSFEILGVVNETWDNITRRHPTFFRHTKWTTTSVPLMAHVSSVQVNDFEIKLYTDSGLTGNTDSEYSYVSKTDEAYYNRKDDIEFKIHSALTTEECEQLGVRMNIAMSTPLYDGEGVLTIYDRNKAVQVKAEQDYCDSYYNDYHLPKTELTLKLHDEKNNISLFNQYVHPANGKKYYVIGENRNDTEGSVELRLREV